MTSLLCDVNQTKIISLMADDRVVLMSAQGYKNLVNPADGKGLHWVTDVNSEIPIKLRQSGPGSEKPTTICELFLN